MRIAFCVLLSMGIWATLDAQEKGLPITISYFSPFGNHFGARVGTSTDIMQWEKASKRGVSPLRNLHLKTQLGCFARPDVSQNYLVNTEIGIRRSASGRKSYLAYSMGLGYLLSSEVVGGSVNLGTGKFDKEREASSSLLPTFNIELGSNKEKPLTFFYRLFYGRKLAFSGENSAFFGLEVGLRFVFINKTKP